MTPRHPVFFLLTSLLTEPRLVHGLLPRDKKAAPGVLSNSWQQIGKRKVYCLVARAVEGEHVGMLMVLSKDNRITGTERWLMRCCV